MTLPIRIRTRTKDGVTEVQILMPHPMESGFRQDAGGALVPAHHITDVVVSIDERTVFAARMSVAVSQDPLLSFRCRGAEPGQTLRVRWTDSHGEARVDQIFIA